ncbi:MAG TPA: response regulator transcription factor [Thermoanaerobaculia bacterium]|jgi:DNA-binding NarL/FixJ family response regulator|nr:response regulator transcription factor [Thermoanaerobaculia bacterium]
MTRIVIIDDHPVVREGLVAALRGVEVVGAFASADEALRTRLQADVVLLDLELPGMSGLEAIPRFDAPVLVLTAYGSDEDIDRALAAGAKGYLLKGAPLDDIERAIAAVAAGESFLDPPAGESFLDPRVTSRLLARSPRERLTPREREVLALVAAGKSNKEIASALRIAERTAKFHVTAILSKLRAENRAQAVAIAAERHLI